MPFDPGDDELLEDLDPLDASEDPLGGDPAPPPGDAAADDEPAVDVADDAAEEPPGDAWLASGEPLAPDDLAAMLEEAVGTYDPELIEGVSFEYDPAPDPECPELLGYYDLVDESITVCDHAADAFETLHHELGHHIVTGDETLRASLAATLEREGFAERHEAFLAQYPAALRRDECCAEAFAQFAGNQDAFEAEYPGAAELLRGVRRP